MNKFEIVILIAGALLIMMILVQSRGAELGSGSGSELSSTRRGLDKSIFQATILIAFVFVGAIIVSILA
jgi:preprotein translocase subunit SecG